MKTFQDKELTDQIDLVVSAIKTGRIKAFTNKMVVAVFRSITLDGGVHIGWNYAPIGTVAGNRFHYDHGVGIGRNKDMEYIWVSPLVKRDIVGLIEDKKVAKTFPRETAGLLTFKDGTYGMGALIVDTSRVDLPPRVNIRCSVSGSLDDLVSLSPLPSEELSIWEESDSLPNDGDELISWDKDESRARHKGPYWIRGTFSIKPDNRRYQNYHGPMVGGLPWTSQGKWQKLSILKDVTYGDYFAHALSDNG
jgi:hypothetical protein